MTETNYGPSPLSAIYWAWWQKKLLLDAAFHYFQIGAMPFDSEFVWSESLQEWVFIGRRACS